MSQRKSEIGGLNMLTRRFIAVTNWGKKGESDGLYKGSFREP